MAKKLDNRIISMRASQYIDDEYEPDWHKLISRYSPTREDVACSLVYKLGGNILDVGCGEGNLLISLSKQYKKLIGIDILDYRIKKGVNRINKNRIKNVTLKVANIEDGLNFKRNSFDVVTCLGVVEYTFDPQFTIREMYKVLKKNGTFILEVPNIGFLGERVKLLFGKLPNVAPTKGWQGGRLHNFTQSSLACLLQKEGFRIENVLGSGFLNRLRSLWPSLFSGNLIFLCKKR